MSPHDHSAFTELWHIASFKSCHFNRCWLLSLSTPTGSFLCSYICVCQIEKEKNSTLRSARSPSGGLSHLNWGQMLWHANDSTCPLSDCQTHTKLTHSFTNSLPLSLSSLLFPLPSPLSLSHLALCKKKCGPPLPLQHFQTERKAKVCNGNKLVVKEKRKNWTVGGPVANYPAQTHFLETLFLLLCHHRKPALIKSELCSSLSARTQLLWSYNVNHVTLP